MSKKKVCSAETAAKLEESRRRDVFENPPDPSLEKDLNMANALKWYSWGWNKVDMFVSKLAKRDHKTLWNSLKTAIAGMTKYHLKI